MGPVAGVAGMICVCGGEELVDNVAVGVVRFQLGVVLIRGCECLQAAESLVSRLLSNEHFVARVVL